MARENSHKFFDIRVMNDVEFLVFGYEPSTIYEWFYGASHGWHAAEVMTKACVDDATKTYGYMYQKQKDSVFGGTFKLVAYACLSGDGGVDFTRVPQSTEDND